MSYDSATVAKLIADIDHNKVYLPALQRKFVWGRQQIELLFDSLMRNYPFGTFLFWKLHRQKADNYVFYEFLKEYDERSPYNRRKTGSFTHEEIVGVLDGQQRLSSIYIGLMGTHCERARYKRRSSASAYEKTTLYLNLLSLPYSVGTDNDIGEREDQNFEFRFLTEDAANRSVSRRVTGECGELLREEPMFWLTVGDVLSWDVEPEFDLLIDDYIANCCETDAQREEFARQRPMVRRGLSTLHERIRRDRLINYFEIAKDDLEDILKIFVRVNSGGTVLSKTDLLFSTIVATWDDGREQIEELQKTINSKGDWFAFGNEFVMRCCLVLSDAPVVYKVNSFRAEHVERMREQWPQISDAIKKTVDLLVEFGFSGELLTSQNAVVIIVYYVFKGGALDAESKSALRKYLIHALLNGIYGGSQDAMINALRNAFRVEASDGSGRRTYEGRFTKITFDDFLKIDLPQQRSLKITDADLDRFLAHTKGAGAFLVLTLLCPHLRYDEMAFHQDHIHPFSGFHEKAFDAMGINGEIRGAWYEMRDRVPNLQLLAGPRNISKNDTPIEDWVGKIPAGNRPSFFAENFFPSNVELAFEDFVKFYEARRVLLKEALRQVLAMAPAASANTGASDDLIDEGLDEMDTKEMEEAGEL